MFESILVRRPSITDGTLDAGLLAEILLFYQNVRLVVDRASIPFIVDSVGIDNFTSLVDDDWIKCSYRSQIVGIYSWSPRGVEIHSASEIQPIPKGCKKYIRERDISEQVERRYGRSWTSKKLAKKLTERMPLDRSFPNGEETSLSGMIRRDFRDERYIAAAARVCLEAVIPNLQLPSQAYFRLLEVEAGNFVIDTNIPIRELAKRAGLEYGPQSVLANISEARADLAFSATHMSEMVASPLSQAILLEKFRDMLAKRQAMSEQLDLFQNTHLRGKTLREAINSGERSFSEFLPLLEDAHRFKTQFLKNADVNAGILSEYHKAVTRDTWVDTLPGKLIRIAGFTGAGVFIDALTGLTGLGTAAGFVAATGANVALDVTDSYIVERMVKGWRPNQFVERKLLPFVDPD